MTTSVKVSADTNSDVRVVEVVTEHTRNVLRSEETLDFTVFDGQAVYIQEIAEGDIPEDVVMLPKSND